jgi:hypothetical protein
MTEDLYEQDNPYVEKKPESKISPSKIFTRIIWVLIILVLLVYGWKILQTIMGVLQ